MAEEAMARLDAPARPRPRDRRRQVRDYSRFVTAMKFVLPVLAAGLIALLAFWSQIRIEEGRFRIGSASIAPTDIDRLSMVNPRFQGIDDQNRPFTVTAAEASQVKGNDDLIDLVRPQADITMENGSWMAVSADSGRYQRSTRQLQLDGRVSLFQDQGYELHVDSIAVDFAAGNAVSNTAVIGQGPAGELSGEGLKVADKGAVIELTGKSRVLLYQGIQQERLP
jgi:lipopolysaccharide export system protein LptC